MSPHPGSSPTRKRADSEGHDRAAETLGISRGELARLYEQWQETGQMVVHELNEDGSPREFTLDYRLPADLAAAMTQRGLPALPPAQVLPNRAERRRLAKAKRRY